jgi:serine/threonine-protein kinase SRPK3
MSLENVHLQRIVEHIGLFPPSFLEACQHRANFFNEQGEMTHLDLSASGSYLLSKGSLLRVHNLFPSSIERCLRPYKVLDEQEIPPIAAFIRRCLTIDPSARPTALELLDDEWLKDA